MRRLLELALVLLRRLLRSLLGMRARVIALPPIALRVISAGMVHGFFASTDI